MLLLVSTMLALCLSVHPECIRCDDCAQNMTTSYVMRRCQDSCRSLDGCRQSTCLAPAPRPTFCLLLAHHTMFARFSMRLPVAWANKAPRKICRLGRLLGSLRCAASCQRLRSTNRVQGAFHDRSVYYDSIKTALRQYKVPAS